MFRAQARESGSAYRLAIAGLLTLSAAALAVTVWIMVDFLREQVIVQQLIQKLPPDSVGSAEELAGELRWQFRLTTLVILNLIVAGIAVLLLWRAYRSSQESLRDIKALAGDILGSMDQAVITTDQRGIVTSINRRGIELLRLQGEFVGRPLADLSDTLPLQTFRDEFNDSELTTLTRDFKTGEPDAHQTLRAFCQPLHNYDRDNIGNIVQLRDVTERKLIDDRLRRMERYMGLGSLAAGLHHEIKNPLAALSLHVQLLEEQLDEEKSSDETRQMLGIIKTEVTRIGSVLEGFRDFASIDNLALAEVDIADMISRQLQLVSPRAEQMRVDVRRLICDSLPPAFADRSRLEQVLLNILVNAMEAMCGGGVLLVQAAPVEGMVEIKVTDSGPGIPAKLQDSIFDPYFTTKSKGTGLGLALCDKIIRQHDGTLEFQSGESGTTFFIRVPIATGA